MSISKGLEERSGGQCELCDTAGLLLSLTVPPKSDEIPDNQVALCEKCHQLFENPEQEKLAHWRCLNNSMWSTVPAVQVVAYRILKSNEQVDWVQDLLNMIYLDEPTLEWAEQENPSDQNSIVHKDANGNILTAGDTVVLIKDLNVKGVSFIAKRGTAVRRISLVHDNAEHIEGRVNDQHIVILTKFVKKS